MVMAQQSRVHQGGPKDGAHRVHPFGSPVLLEILGVHHRVRAKQFLIWGHDSQCDDACDVARSKHGRPQPIMSITATKYASPEVGIVSTLTEELLSAQKTKDDLAHALTGAKQDVARLTAYAQNLHDALTEALRKLAFAQAQLDALTSTWGT